MFVIQVDIQVKPDRAEQFIAATKENAGNSMAVPRSSKKYITLFPDDSGWGRA